MRMSFGLSLQVSQRHVQRQVQRHMVLQTQHIAVRLELIRAVHGERYEPAARCPNCLHPMTTEEILKGFLQCATDVTTGCPNCEHRFTPKLIAYGVAGNIELPFYCAMQTLARLKSIEPMSSVDFDKAEPAIYRSAIFHFGTLRSAYERNGTKYPFEPVQDWVDKIVPFLGQAPDTHIAAVVDQKVAVIRRMRKEREIPRYVKAKA